MFILLAYMQSFRPGQVLIPVIQMNAHDVMEYPSKTNEGRCGNIFPPLSEKNVCISACMLALFQLHALHWVQHTSTLLSNVKGLEG